MPGALMMKFSSAAAEPGAPELLDEPPDELEELLLEDELLDELEEDSGTQGAGVYPAGAP